MAGFQTHGRGQHGRKWQSVAEQNLLFSSVLYPRYLHVAHGFALNLVTSVALHKLITQYLPNKDVGIKWPNDLLVEGKKIAGILIHTSLNNNHIDHAIVSIGLNVNQQDFGGDLPFASSLRRESGRDIDLQQVFDRLLIELESCMENVKALGTAQLYAYYHNHLYGIDQQVKIEQKNLTTEEGIFRGVDDQGRMIVQNKTGEYVFISSAQAIFEPFLR